MYKLDAWYNRQNETHRFLLFMGLMCLAVIPMHVGMNLQIYPLALFGGVILSFMTCWGLVRSFSMSLIARIIAAVLLAATIAMTVSIMLINLFG